MDCIYCRKPSGKSRSVAHVLPEAIWPGGPALPKGAVCDACNHYCGHELEAHLVRHPLIALALQMDALPGKRGVPRKQLGIFQRGVEEGAAVTFPIREPVQQYDENGIRTSFGFQIDLVAGYDMDRFRRALHHAAFNVAVLEQGVEAAFEARYDAVRQYVRQPKRGERWTFVQVRADVKRYRRVPRAAHRQADADFPDTELVSLEMLSGTWMVDLLNSGRLLTLRSNLKTTQIFAPDWQPPERPPADPTKHYRVSIF